jgi:hypothetical protein
MSTGSGFIRALLELQHYCADKLVSRVPGALYWKLHFQKQLLTLCWLHTRSTQLFTRTVPAPLLVLNAWHGIPSPPLAMANTRSTQLFSFPQSLHGTHWREWTYAVHISSPYIYHTYKLIKFKKPKIIYTCSFHPTSSVYKISISNL